MVLGDFSQPFPRRREFVPENDPALPLDP